MKWDRAHQLLDAWRWWFGCFLGAHQPVSVSIRFDHSISERNIPFETCFFPINSLHTNKWRTRKGGRRATSIFLFSPKIAVRVCVCSREPRYWCLADSGPLWITWLGVVRSHSLLVAMVIEFEHELLVKIKCVCVVTVIGSTKFRVVPASARNRLKGVEAVWIQML